MTEAKEPNVITLTYLSRNIKNSALQELRNCWYRMPKVVNHALYYYEYFFDIGCTI